MASMLVDKLELDDRREIWRLLEKLNQFQRIRFVQRCCGGVKGKGAVGVTSHSGTVGEAYRDLMMLAVVFGADLHAVALDLVKVVRKVA